MSEFREEPRGTVVSQAPDPFAGAVYHVWFPYSKTFVLEIREGSLIAVRNFASGATEKRFSILELVTVTPVHYALGATPSETEKSFPGFVVEAAKSARQDWEQEEPIEHTTKIKCEAIPTGLELVFGSVPGPVVEIDRSVPMMGEEALLLTDPLTEKIVNKGLTDGIRTISPAKMVLNPAVSVKLSVDDLLRTHFGVFGFTAAGKSNLVSTMVADLLGSGSDVKVVVFDLMAEYPALLIDCLEQLTNSFILAIGEDSLPGGEPTKSFLRGISGAREAVDVITRTLLVPKALAPHRDDFKQSFSNLLSKKKIRVYDPGAGGITVGDLRAQLEAYVTGTLGKAKVPIKLWMDARLGGEPHLPIPLTEIKAIHAELSAYVAHGRIPEDFAGPSQQSTLMTQGPGAVSVELGDTARQSLKGMLSVVGPLTRGEEKRSLPLDVRTSLISLKDLLSTPGSPSLVIVQCNRDDELRSVGAQIVNSVFDERRRVGRITPSVLFIFDEADEFIPSESEKRGPTYVESRDAVTILARRGRKFGLGVGIATQRVAYLDTSIMAQLHTYLISKLTREYDRKAIASAYGISEDLLQRTLKFMKGQWLLVSFDATGLENVPIPVQFPNANERVLKHLKNH